MEVEEVVELDLLEALEDKENYPKVKSCGICGDLHYYRECAYVVINNKILDTPIPPKAFQSLPSILNITKLADETYSVFAKSLVELGTEFGPFSAKKSLTLDPNTLFPVKVFNDSELELTENYLNCTNEYECCWMMFVKPAEDVGEQNLICYQEQDDIYFGAIKDIEPGEELKVWYAPYYASKMQKHLLTFKDTTHLQNIEFQVNLGEENKGLDHLVSEQQNIVPRAIWNCKFCYKLEKSVTDFAKHLIGHYCLRQKKVCEFCKVSFNYKADYNKHLKRFHRDPKPENAQSGDSDPKNNPMGEPLILQCLDIDSSNFLLPQSELNIVNLENLDNNLLLDDSMRLGLDIIGTEDGPNTNNNNGNKEFVCDICLKKFKSVQLISAHLRMHCGIYYCASCNKVFGRPETLKHHKCNTYYSYKCPKCPRVFAQKKRLNYHVKVFHDLKHSCRLCHRKCFSRYELRKHLCPKSSNTVIKCPKCPSKLSSERSYRQHLKMHENYCSVKYVCAKCSRIYASKNLYDRHMKTVHLKIKELSCQICDKKFARRDNLNTHLMEIHLSKPMKETFECKFCQKHFGSKRILHCHVQNIHTHRKRAKFSCDSCQLSFIYSRNFLRHQKLVHTNAKIKNRSYKCTFCPRSYGHSRSLHNHMKEKHSEEANSEKINHKCPHCQKVFGHFRSLQTHVKEMHSDFNETLKPNKEEETVNCPECWYKCPKRNKKRLLRHVKIEHLERYDSFCQEFNVEKKMFKCPECPKEFVLNDSLKKHLKTHNNSKLESIIPKDLLSAEDQINVPVETKKPIGEICPVCGHKVKFKWSLLRHMKLKHPKENADGPWTDLNSGTLVEKNDEKDTNVSDEDYMDLQKTIENMDFNDMVNDNQLSCNEFIDKFLKESSDQISLFLADSPKQPLSTVNISDLQTPPVVNDQSNRRDPIGFSIPDFPDLDFSEIELEPLGPPGGRIMTPSTTTSINDIPDVVLYVLNDK